MSHATSRMFQTIALSTVALCLSMGSARAYKSITVQDIIDCIACRDRCEDDLFAHGSQGLYESCLLACPFEGNCPGFGIAVFGNAWQAVENLDREPVEGSDGAGWHGGITSTLNDLSQAEGELLKAFEHVDSILGRAEERLARMAADAAEPASTRRLVELMVVIARAREAVGEDGRLCLAEIASR